MILYTNVFSGSGVNNYYYGLKVQNMSRKILETNDIPLSIDTIL